MPTEMQTLPSQFVKRVDVPGGELGGTYQTPTVDPTHSGSPHSNYLPLTGGNMAGAIATASGPLNLSPASGLAVAVASGQGVAITGLGGVTPHRVSITPVGVNDEASKTVISGLTDDLVALLLVSNDSSKTSAIFALASSTITKLAGPASWVATDTDGFECVLIVGTDVVIKNRLGVLRYFSAAVFISG